MVIVNYIYGFVIVVVPVDTVENSSQPEDVGVVALFYAECRGCFGDGSFVACGVFWDGFSTLNPQKNLFFSLTNILTIEKVTPHIWGCARGQNSPEI
jgi:hypothetical protein